MPQEILPEAQVLIVDPDLLFGRILKSKLEKMGYAARVEKSGVAALECLKTDVFRIVITELDPSDVSGPDLCRHIRALDRPYYTYIFVFSSRKDKEALLQVLEAGADDYIQKPLDFLEFRLRMKTAERMLALDDEVHFGGGTDRATGLINRNAFLQFFRAIVSECQRGKTIGTLLFVEIANYRDIYHGNGFEAAQCVQSALAKRLSSALRTSDVLARISDGVFCLLLQDSSSEQCCSIAGIVLGRMGEAGIAYEEATLLPDIRISMVSFPQEDMTAEDILNSPDRIFCPKPVLVSSGANAS